jgi:integrase
VVTKRGKYWHTDFPFDGERIRESTGETKKGLAEKVANQMLKNLEEGKEAKLKIVPILKDFAVETFLPYVEAHTRIKPRSKENYQYGWSLLASQPIAKMRLNQIKHPHLDMVNVEGSPSRHNCALRTLSRMLNIARELEIIAIHPAMKRHLLEEVERDQLPEDVEQRMAVVLDGSKRRGSLRTGLYVVLDAGLRPFEVVAIDIKDIDFDRKRIWVPVSKSKAGTRYAPITARLREKLMGQIGSRTEGWLFPSPRYPGQHIQRQALSSAWRIAAKKAGVSADVDLYCARHSFGTDVMEATKNVFQLLTVMGQGDPKTAGRYQHHETAGVGLQLDALRAERHNLRHRIENGLQVVP